jgi:hypothetical protein
MTREPMASQPMTPQAAAVAFLAMATAARIEHDRQLALVRASVLTCPDPRAKS